MYKLWIYWNDGTKETYTYETKEEAQSVQKNMYRAFGSQLFINLSRD